MARAHPMIALIVVLSGLGWEVGGKKNAGGGRIADKGIESRFYLGLAGVGPDRPREKEIESRAKDGRIKICVEIETWLFQIRLSRRKEILESILHSLASRFDAGIAARIEKTDEPVGDPQASAANLKNRRLRMQAFLEQGDQLFAASLLERLDWNTQKTVPRHHFFRLRLHSRHGPRPWGGPCRTQPPNLLSPLDFISPN